jgi:hypothetical protein
MAEMWNICIKSESMYFIDDYIHIKLIYINVQCVKFEAFIVTKCSKFFLVGQPFENCIVN